MYVTVKELGNSVIQALKSVSYGRADILIEATEQVDGSVAGGSGRRGFIIILNVDTGQWERKMGSWGGSSPFSTSPVDAGESMIAIPVNGIVIKGTVGNGTWATIYANPQAMGRMLPSGEPADELSDADQQALYCFGSIKGGEYRRDEMRRRNVSEDTVDSLVERGYLKRNRAGATQITTAGKNARTIRY